MTSEYNRRRTDLAAFENTSLKAEIVKLEEVLANEKHQNKILTSTNHYLKESNIELIGRNERHFIDGFKIGFVSSLFLCIALFIVYLAWHGSLW